VGGKRLRVEVLLAAASQPEPPPVTELVGPELLALLPGDLPDLLALLPEADLYLQDEVEFALHPTLTRLWMPKGRRNQRLIEAPGDNEKVHGFGLVDWRDGWLHTLIAPGRTADPFCEQLEAAVSRSKARRRQAIVLCDNARTHTPQGSLKVPGTRSRVLLAKHEGGLILVYTPKYDPDSNRIERLWHSSRKEVTHNHGRGEFKLLRQDAETHLRRLREQPERVLRQIGSPYALAHDSADPQDLAA